MSDWHYLKAFCGLLENTEVPPRFAMWCGIGSLLGALERRVWLSQGVFNVYPNFYFILVAGSGQKKSTPINYVDKLLRRVKSGPNMVAQKVSPEALITALKQTPKSEDNKVLKQRCGGIVLADELTTFIDRGSIERGLIPVLTKLWDCTNFEYQTLSRGTETISDGYLSLLGGTTIELVRNALPKDSIGGGLTSRMIFIYEDKLSPPVAWIEVSNNTKDQEVALVEHLAKVVRLSGEISISPEAKKRFTEIYNHRYYHSRFRHDPTLQGYENRRSVHLLKVAMAFMVCDNNPQLVLTLDHLTAAETALCDAEDYMPKVMGLIVATDIGAQNSIVFSYIESHQNGVTRSDIVKRFSHQFNAVEMSKILDTLVIAKRVDTFTRDRSIVYKAVKESM